MTKPVCSFLFFICFQIYGQKLLQISGGMDFYYVVNPMDLNQEKVPIYVSSNQLNATDINLAIIEFNYKPNERYRFLISPALGSYMNSNYSSEKRYLRWIYEGYFGFSIKKKKTKQWIDFGVFSSPFTFETPKSWDQIAYTRSLAPEFVPYYVTGIRHQNEITKNLKLTLFILNGWQKIEFQNKIPSLATQLEWRKNKNYLNWTTYSGNEKTKLSPNLGSRFFSELSWSYETEKFRTQSCIYIGTQQIKNIGFKNWWQINGIFDYKISLKSDIYIRHEYFHDPHKIQIQTPTNAIGFSGHATSLGFSHKLTDYLLARLEGKSIFGKNENELFFYKNKYSNFLPLLFANITIRF
jgi:hypothetical protein